MPKCNYLNIKLNSEHRNTIYLKVMQSYNGSGYDERCTTKYFTKNDINKTYGINIVSNVLTEISIYTSWNSFCDENIDVSIEGLQKDTYMNKHLYELNETPILYVNRYLDTDTFKTELNITSIITKYHPITAVIDRHDSRYIDKDGKLLKKLVLTYNINEHKNTTYYINTSNKIYETDGYMSGNIYGYKDDKHIFFANYVPKCIKEAVDKIDIVFMFSDDKNINRYLDTVLTATRNSKTNISSNNICRGINYIDMNDMYKKIILTDIYDGDYIKCTILDQHFMVLYKKRLDI